MSSDTASSADPVQDYLDRVEDPGRAQALANLRSQIMELIPQAKPVISYNLPAFAVNMGTEDKPQFKVVCGFAATAKGYSLYPFSGTVVEHFKAELGGFSTTKGSIHCTLEHGLPRGLLAQIVQYRLDEIASRGR